MLIKERSNIMIVNQHNILLRYHYKIWQFIETIRCQSLMFQLVSLQFCRYCIIFFSCCIKICVFMSSYQLFLLLSPTLMFVSRFTSAEFTLYSVCLKIMHIVASAIKNLCYEFVHFDMYKQQNNLTCRLRDKG